MKKQSNFLNHLIEARPSLPNKQEMLCNFMIENINSVALLTVAELASAANVGTTTVMRLIKNLGFDSYSDVKKELLNAASIQTPHSAWWHLQESFKKQKVDQHVLLEVGQESKNLLSQTVSPRLISKFEEAVKLILKSKRVNVLGTRSNRALALYFGYLLEEFFPEVNQL